MHDLMKIADQLS